MNVNLGLLSRSTLSRLTLLGALLATGLGLSMPSQADAQCLGWLCADIEVQLGPPRPRRVYVVQQAPPAPPPPPRVVYVQPSAPPPPQVVVVAPPQQQQQPVYVQQPYQQYQQPVQQPQPQADEHRRFGLHGQVGSFLSDRIRIGGVSGALRFRPSPRFALDIGAGAYGGRDYNGLDRVEVPVTADFLVFFNPQHRLQVYGIAGAGVSWALAEGTNRDTGQFESHEYMYIGAQAGLGLEWRVGPRWAFNFDVRGFVRQQINDEEPPEFVDPDSGDTTNTSAGATVNLGATLYF